MQDPECSARWECDHGKTTPQSCAVGTANSILAFFRALLNQVSAVKLSMRAIREVIPGALLVQTEDMGKTYSTELLGYQSGLENERRWLSLDLVCGRLTCDHPLWPYLKRMGVKYDHVAEFADDRCPAGHHRHPPLRHERTLSR